MKRAAVIAVLVAAAAIVVWRYPLFHIVRTDQVAAEGRSRTNQQAFDAAQFAETFWRERLLPSLGNAVNVEAFLSAYSDNPEQVRKQHGRSVGVSRQTLYLLQAGGTIVSVDKKGVGLALGDGTVGDIVLPTGPLFGNAVRDCTGLIRPGDFPNSQQFNDLSAELNRIVEAQVIEPLAKNAAVGQQVHVVGCVELSNSESEVKPLLLIPLQVRFDKPLRSFDR
jgi:predicted lipoprotein